MMFFSKKVQVKLNLLKILNLKSVKERRRLVSAKKIFNFLDQLGLLKFETLGGFIKNKKMHIQ